LCTFSKIKTIFTYFKHKESIKLLGNLEVTSIIDYFVTNMKTSKVIQDIRVYGSVELDGDYYLLRAKANFSPRWLNKNKKSFNKARKN
jgi:hypothetical protein